MLCFFVTVAGVDIIGDDIRHTIMVDIQAGELHDTCDDVLKFD